MIQPLIIGKHTFSSNLVQGPLAGFSCAAMRVQTWKFSQPAYCSSEMISATHLVHAKTAPRRYLERDAAEGALCIQLSGSNAEDLRGATAKINALNPEIIELNCGCPVNKIRRKQAGSKLLSQPEHLASLVHAMRQETDAALSVKIRVAGDHTDQDDLTVAQSVEAAGADCLVVHGRHWTEGYDIQTRYDQIARLVQAVNIPVIGNGDVCDSTSLQSMLNQTGCAGVMIARAATGQPWIFAQLTSANFQLPALTTIGETFIDHIERLAALDSPFRAVLQARKLAKYYAQNHLTKKNEFLHQVMQCQDLGVLKTLIQSHFSTTG